MSQTFRTNLRKFKKHLLDARERNLNEADTVVRLIEFFQNVLGYNVLTEISRETQLRGKFIDVAIKIDGSIKFLVEAKAAKVKLRERHIEQAEAYASHNNLEWVVLTNGVEWHLYHLTFDEGIENMRVFGIDLSEDSLDKAEECLSLLSRSSIKRNKHAKFFEKASALSAGSIGQCLFSEDVLRVLRREIRKECGILVDEEDLAQAVRRLLSQQTREEIGAVRIRRRRRTARAPRKRKAATSPEESKSAVPVSSQPTVTASEPSPVVVAPRGGAGEAKIP